MILKSLIILIAYLLMNLASTEIKICCILSIILSPYLKRFLVVMSKFLYSKLNITIIAILSQISWFDFMATFSHFIRNCRFVKIPITNFLMFFCLLICGYLKNIYRIEYITFYSTYKHIIESFSYIS